MQSIFFFCVWVITKATSFYWVMHDEQLITFFKWLAQWCYFYAESELAGGFYFEAVTKTTLYSGRLHCVCLSLTSNRIKIFITGRNTTAVVHRGRQNQQQKRRFSFKVNLSPKCNPGSLHTAQLNHIHSTQTCWSLSMSGLPWRRPEDEATANVSCSETFLLVNSVYTNNVLNARVHV